MNLVLGVTGSIAAYRAADLARDLMRAGFTVRVCLSDSAQRFVTPALFEALTGQPCLIDTFEEPEIGRMAHIDWARQADAILIAPATANTINRLAAGIAEDMLTTIALASTAPMVIAPAMNPAMYRHEVTQQSLDRLKERGVEFIEPAEGDVACGENGQGKLASNEAVVSQVIETTRRSTLLKGKRVLISSGPTEEPIDSVRVLTNRSSGKMGSALARAARNMGAAVTVVAGPQRAPLPASVTTIPVRTAQQMLSAMTAEAPSADIIIGAAAVADFRMERPVTGKIRREGNLVLELTANPDILTAVSQVKRPDSVLIGFAAEPDEGTESARKKIEKKGLDGIAINDISQAGIGFDSEHNELAFLDRTGTLRRSGRMSKYECAVWLLHQIVGA